MIPGAFLAEKFGGKWILSVVVFGGAICTLLSPIIANQYGFMGLVILRIIQGILQVKFDWNIAYFVLIVPWLGTK